MSKSSLSLKGTMDPQSLAQILEDMAKSIKAGTLCLQKGVEFVTLKPCGSMDFTIEAGVKKGKQKLEISVKWEEPAELSTPEEITISDVEPELPACEPEGVEPQAQDAPQTEEDAPDMAGGPLAVDEPKAKEARKSKKK